MLLENHVSGISRSSSELSGYAIACLESWLPIVGRLMGKMKVFIASVLHHIDAAPLAYKIYDREKISRPIGVKPLM
jgi:hypothetical protein